jgi:hypothetical protein
MVSDPAELVAVLTGDAIWSAAAASA